MANLFDDKLLMRPGFRRWAVPAGARNPFGVRASVAAALTIVSSGCGPAPPAGPAPESPAEACVVGTRSVDDDGRISIGLTGRVHPADAPVPQTESERFVFRLLYETLVSVDCDGRLHPGLAEAWRSDTHNRVWTFTLRDAAEFWDGVRVSALDVISSWRARPGARALVRVDSVTVLGDQLRVALTSPTPSAAMFAHPALAVARRGPGAVWPAGTTPIRVELGPAASSGVVRIHLAGATRPLVEFARASVADERDFLDRGVDVLVTDRPRTLDYAATRASEFNVVPLPWNQTYVVLAPRRIHDQPTGRLPDRLLHDLARDAVRVNARAAEAPFWWLDASRCGFDTSTLGGGGAAEPSTNVSRRIVYGTRDDTAREIAERLVALAGSPGDRRDLESIDFAWSAPAGAISATGLEAARFSASLRAGAELGYVIPVPRVVLNACAETLAILRRAPWLLSAPHDAGTALTRALVPLVDVRLHAVLRRERVSATADWDGTLRVVVP